VCAPPLASPFEGRGTALCPPFASPAKGRGTAKRWRGLSRRSLMRRDEVIPPYGACVQIPWCRGRRPRRPANPAPPQHNRRRGAPVCAPADRPGGRSLQNRNGVESCGGMRSSRPTGMRGFPGVGDGFPVPPFPPQPQAPRHINKPKKSILCIIFFLRISAR